MQSFQIKSQYYSRITKHTFFLAKIKIKIKLDKHIKTRIKYITISDGEFSFSKSVA